MSFSITQPPTLNVIDLPSNQYSIAFGVNFQSPITDGGFFKVPNVANMQGELVTVDLTSINAPASGNFPSVRSLQVSLNVFLVGNPPSGQIPALYVWNPQTNLLYSFRVPLAVTPIPDAEGNTGGTINAVVPFYAKSTQSIQLFWEMMVPDGAFPYAAIACSFTAFTFDTPGFYASSAGGS
jgi:hypothetical protein